MPAADLTTPAERNPTTLALLQPDGTASSLAAVQGKHATALVFMSTECPISNGYSAELNRLHRAFAAQGLAVVGIHSNAGQGLVEIREQVRDFQLEFPVLRDPGGKLAELLEIKLCPTALVLNAAGKEVYRGRIDDRYVQRGSGAREVKQHDLLDALTALAAGQAIAHAVTQPIGCPLRAAPALARVGGETKVTYSQQVSRILQQSCQSCHRPNGPGPFSLLTYQEAVTWAEDIRRFTAERKMPPWKPAPGWGEFQHARTLSDLEIQQLDQWVTAGCPQGEERDAPVPLEFREGWKLGTPDLVLTMPAPFEIPADGPDLYRCFILPTDATEHRYVTAMEVLPGDPEVVHHVLAFMDTLGQARKLDARDAGPGYATKAGFPGFLPSGGLGGWAPGNTADFLPAGMGRVLPALADVVLQVHYHPTGRVVRDQTRIGIYFSKVPVTRAVRNRPILPPSGPFGGLQIPAGDPNYEIRTEYVLTRDSLLVSVTPHMHLLGKEMQLSATLPDGTRQQLVWVRDWDFNWQESYHYQQPVALPTGTKLELIGRFDNSAANPRNPRNPPQQVGWGEQTTDEMCIAFLEIAPREVARSAADLGPQRPGQMIFEQLSNQLTPKFRWPQLKLQRAPD